MLVGKRVNLSRYFVSTAGLVLGLLFFTSWKPIQVLTMVVCSVGISAGLFVLVRSVAGLSEQGNGMEQGRRNRKKMLLLSLVKLPLMAGILLGSVHFMDGLVLLPLALYLGQIVVLFLSLKRV